jgi:hypothetical protein
MLIGSVVDPKPFATDPVLVPTLNIYSSSKSMLLKVFMGILKHAALFQEYQYLNYVRYLIFVVF